MRKDLDLQQIVRALGLTLAMVLVLLLAACEGTVGEPGIQGERGLQGEQGIEGSQGTVGERGLQGEQGDEGDQGPQGKQGDEGTLGLPGQKGEKGDAGEPGTTGEPGIQGAPGPQGARGERGQPGITGPPGRPGFPGAPGVGLQGPQGESSADFMSAIESVRDSVVCVAISSDDIAYQCASGFYVDSRGTVLTAAHVVSPTDFEVTSIQVSTGAVSNQPYTIKRDLPGITAVLLSPVDRVQSVPVRIAPEYAQGEPIMTMGYPDNLIAANTLIVMTGVIGGRATWGSSATGIPYIIMNTDGSYGSSGGPVVNVNGEVVGFIEGGSHADPFTYAIDIAGRSFE